MIRNKALLASNHLLYFSGSEIVLLEAAEYLQRNDFDVSVFAHVTSPPLREEFDKLAVQWINDPTTTNALDFDFIWHQHRTLPLFQFEESESSQERTLIIGARLSPFEPFEAPGGIVEEGLQDLTVVNSDETAQAMSSFGIEAEKIRIFHNAAPVAFHGNHRQISGLQNILVISNHAPAELLSGLQILKDGCLLKVEHIGLGGNPRRITPEVVQSADLVVTIGKSVQYALMGGIPVYCYDHFAGPGYIVEPIYDQARARNFSGRGWNDRKSPEKIAQEILSGFQEALNFAATVREKEQQRFSLDFHLDSWRKKDAKVNIEKRLFVQTNQHLLLRERRNAQLIAREYVKEFRTRR